MSGFEYSSYEKASREAKTMEQYIAAQMALCLEQTGELPTIEEIHMTYLENLDQEFEWKFGRVTDVSVIDNAIFNIFRCAIMKGGRR